MVNSTAGDIVISEEIGKSSTAIHRFDNTPLMLEELYRGGVEPSIGDITTTTNTNTTTTRRRQTMTMISSSCHAAAAAVRKPACRPMTMPT